MQLSSYKQILAGILMSDTINIKLRFFDSLKRGTGEAYLIAKENPTIDFSTYIIKGALRNFAYDGQSENSRAQYIFDLILLSDKKEKIRKAILKGLATEKEDTWSLTHLFDLVKLYAQQGDIIAKRAIYDRFLNHPIDHSDWVGYQEIIELDGFKGLVCIAKKFGKMIEQNPENWQTSSIINHFQDKNPQIEAKKELNKLAKSNKYIDLYLKNIKKTEKNWKNNKPKPSQFNDIIDEILQSKYYLSYRRSKELTEKELNRISHKLLLEKDSSNKEKLIEIFTEHKFPLDSYFILNLAKQRANSKNRITEFAISALKFLKSNEIRQFLLDKLTKTNHPEHFVDIFVSNYKYGDFIFLKDIAQNIKNKHTIESLARSYVDIFTANKTKECKEPLEVLYGKMNCGIHRHSIIEVLIDNNILSDKLKEEIRYDSYLETRKLL